MKLNQKQKEILELWQHGYHLQEIANKGYPPHMIDEVIGNYTRTNARRWLKKGG